jgi:hypothetical protein
MLAGAIPLIGGRVRLDQGNVALRTHKMKTPGDWKSPGGVEGKPGATS